MGILGLLAVHLLLVIVGFAWMWRRVDRLNAEVARLRAMLEASQLARLSQTARRTPQRAFAAIGAGVEADDVYRESWRGGLRSPSYTRPLTTDHESDEAAPLVSPHGVRLLAAAATLLAPLAALPVAPGAAVAAAGLMMSAALLLLCLRSAWRDSAWIAAGGAALWSVFGIAFNVGPSAGFAIAAGCAGVAGLSAARLGLRNAGLASATIAAVLTLTLTLQWGVISPPGGAFAIVAAASALIGAYSLRLELLHAAGFAGACAGLFVLSGQAEAAIWFTPAAAVFGALFFAIAALRTPVLRSRALLLTATGVTAPLFAVNALFAAQHGLADPRAAAAAFFALALLFAGVLALAARRTIRGVTQLKAAAWVLTGGSLTALTAAVFLAIPAPLATTAMAVSALGLMLLDRRAPHVLWRRAAMAAALMGLVGAYLGRASEWPALGYIAAALAAPAALAAASAFVAHIRGRGTAAFFEAAAILGAALTIFALIRATFAALGAGAQIGFVEIGAQTASALSLSLALAARAHRGARRVRLGAAMVLAGSALLAMLIAGLLWLTPHWLAAPTTSLPPLLQHAPLGFALPAMLAWAHWAYWRETGGNLRTRTAMAAAGVLTAAFASFEVATARAPMAGAGIDWIVVTAAFAAFGLALGINFAPGVVSASTPRRSRL